MTDGRVDIGVNLIHSDRTNTANIINFHADNTGSYYVKLLTIEEIPLSSVVSRVHIQDNIAN